MRWELVTGRCGRQQIVPQMREDNFRTIENTVASNKIDEFICYEVGLNDVYDCNMGNAPCCT